MENASQGDSVRLQYPGLHPMQQQAVSGFPNCTGGKMSITSFNGGQPLGARPTTAQAAAVRPKVTTTTIQDKKHRHEPISCLTAYDYPSAWWTMPGSTSSWSAIRWRRWSSAIRHAERHRGRHASPHAGGAREREVALVVGDMPYSHITVDRRVGAQCGRFIKGPARRR